MAIDVNEIQIWTHSALQVGLKVMYALLVFFVGWWLSRRVARLLGQMMHAREIDKTFTLFFTRILFYFFMIFVVMTVLSMVGVRTTSLVAVLGGMSIAIGLSLKSSLSNLASGIL